MIDDVRSYDLSGIVQGRGLYFFPNIGFLSANLDKEYFFLDLSDRTDPSVLPAVGLILYPINLLHTLNVLR